MIATTAYFREQVLRKRPYLDLKWCMDAIAAPDYKMIQDDGRIRYYIFVAELDKFLRVVTLDDGVTLHNAFPDRDFDIKLLKGH